MKYSGSITEYLNSPDGILTIIIVAFVFALQLWVFIKNVRKMLNYRSAFPKDPKGTTKIVVDTHKRVVELESSFGEKNKIWQNILDSINAYLSNNKNNVSDFHILKDVVDRNCETKEYEIETQISIPINLGLMGTMTGILVGVGFFTFSGGLYELLNPSNNTGDSSFGIIMLLSGVAVAMSTSIIGIIFSTLGSYIMKETVSVVDNNKNAFLSWLQAKLLPMLNIDTAQTIERLTHNLGHFNEAFSDNTIELKNTLSAVTTTYSDIADTVNAISELDVSNIASANIDVYEKLKDSTKEIEELSKYLNEINRHQTSLADGVKSIDSYFLKAIEHIERLDIGMKDALENFKQSSSNHILNLKEGLERQIGQVTDTYVLLNTEIANRGEEVNTSIDNSLENQQELLKEHLKSTLDTIKEFAKAKQDIFTQKGEELVSIVDEIKNISAVKGGINVLMQESRVQTEQMKDLTKAIKELAEIKTTGKISYPKIPIYIKKTGLALTILFITTCLYLLSPLFINVAVSILKLLKLK